MKYHLVRLFIMSYIAEIHLNPQNRIMNRLKLGAFLAIFTLTFSACSTKDKNADTILGDWSAQMMIQTLSQGGTIVDSDTMRLELPTVYSYVSFKADNVVVTEFMGDDGVEKDTGYYSVSGNTLTLGDSASDPEKEAYTFQLAGNTLILRQSQEVDIRGEVYIREISLHLKRR